MTVKDVRLGLATVVILASATAIQGQDESQEKWLPAPGPDLGQLEGQCGSSYNWSPASIDCIATALRSQGDLEQADFLSRTGQFLLYDHN